MKPIKSGFDDLVEFYNQWPDLRGQIQQLLEDKRLAPEQREIVRSMMHVVDCVGPADLIEN